ncbi:hypothetical protein ARMSODRAFT_955332 [Armillaria solidipes]|uniref:MYND-type domain-containing protein n=1 Tax=Armillaria solidipes TaxID=1076256 RepID=A0A2H3BIB0_9AGAR|nr:hypothetical protein ARMSODRAFT_955332 [Armillaria solidipes]
MSSFELVALSSLAASDPRAFRDVCAAVRHQLRRAGQRGRTSVASSKPSSKLDTVAECFKSLWIALGSENSKVLGDPSNITLLVELWPELCSWIVEYLQSFVAEASKTSNLQDSLATSDTLNLLHLLSENDRLLCLMVRSLDLMSCLTEVSVHLLLSETRSPSEYLLTMQILMKGGCSDEKTNEGVRAAIRKALDDMAPTRITMVLFRIVHLTERPDTSGSDIFTTIRFLQCCSMCSSAFHANHLIHGSVPWICRLLARMLKRFNGTLYHHHYQQAPSCASYLRLCIDKGPRWASQAVECHLIELLLKVLPVASNSFTKTISDLFESIHVFLLFRGVLRHACRSLLRIERLGLEIHLANASVTARETWESFKEVLEDRWCWRDVVATKGEFHECANIKCPNAIDESPPPVRRCQGCLNAFYCSRDCQRKVWRTHKKDCQNVQRERREGFSPQISRRDLHFIRFVAMQDIEDSADDVRDAMAKSVSSVNNDWFKVVVVDYTTAPRSITVALMRRDHLYAEWPELMEQLFRIIISTDGGTEFEIFSSTVLESLL